MCQERRLLMNSTPTTLHPIFFKEILPSKCATSPLSANYYSCFRTLKSLVSLNVYARHDWWRSILLNHHPHPPCHERSNFPGKCLLRTLITGLLNRVLRIRSCWAMDPDYLLWFLKKTIGSIKKITRYLTTTKPKHCLVRPKKHDDRLTLKQDSSEQQQVR